MVTIQAIKKHLVELYLKDGYTLYEAEEMVNDAYFRGAISFDDELGCITHENGKEDWFSIKVIVNWRK